MKKRPKTVSTSIKIVYFKFSTLKTVLFGQVPPNPYQTHHSDPVSLLLDGSGSETLRIFRIPQQYC